MDWNNYNNTINPQNSSLPSRPLPPFSSSRLPHQYHDSASLSFFYNYNNHYDPYQVVEMKHDMSMMSGGGGYDLSQEKKKRLTTDQLESLENSFQEEIKLDPDRKMKLAKDLGLQPRQIAVWFQNRRARWKAKNLERLYDSIKQELDVMSRENQKLQEEVLALRAIVKEQGGYRKPASTAGYTEMSGTEETVESSSNRLGGGNGHQLTAAECSYVFNVNDYDPAATMATYWAGHQLPSYP